MDKKVEELANISEDFTGLKDILINSETNQKGWDYKLEELEINQPLLITSVAYPIILNRNNQVMFTFDGRTLFLDLNYSKNYIFVPFAIQDACFYDLKNKKGKSKTALIMLDIQNKLQYSYLNTEFITETRVTISRNVLKMTKYNGCFYYLSFKNNIYFLNTIFEDNEGLKPRAVLHGLVCKYSMDFFCTKSYLFLYSDKTLLDLSLKKLNVKGQFIVGLKDYIVIGKQHREGMLLQLCNSEMIIKSELLIQNTSLNYKFREYDQFICGMIGSKIYFITLNKKELIITNEIECGDNLLDFSVIVNGKDIILYKMLRNDKITNKKDVETYLTQNTISEQASVNPNAKIYDPSVSSQSDIELSMLNEDYKSENVSIIDSKSCDNNKSAFCGIDKTMSSESPKTPVSDIKRSDNEDIMARIADLFERKLEERDARERKRQYELLDKISSNFNSTLLGVVEKIIKSEISSVQRNITNLLDMKLKNFAKKDLNEVRILEFVREIICETLLPIVEASMDEMRIQVVSEVSSFKDSNYLKEIKTALENLKIKDKHLSNVELLIRSENIEKAVLCVIEGDKNDMEDLIKYLVPETLERVSSNTLVALFEKALLLAKEEYKKEYNELISHIISNIELDSLDDDHLDILLVVLSQFLNHEVFENTISKDILAIVKYLKLRIPKILFKRQKALKN